nr:MAG TPA: hypothetical protein [Caudoviricetes sp.]
MLQYTAKLSKTQVFLQKSLENILTLAFASAKVMARR